MKLGLTLIDADGLAFHALRETLHESLEVLDSKINNIFAKTQATHYSMFLSGGKYFRHDLFDGYKKLRERQKQRITWKNTLKAVLSEKYGAVKMYNVEADDLVSFMYYNFKEVDTKIIASPDKDLLFNIPGTHFNYSYKLEVKEDPSSVIEGWWIDTTKEDAEINFWASMIIGDSTDGIIGLHGKGSKYVEKLFEANTQKGKSFRDIVFSEYIDYHGESKGIYEFQKTYRALNLLSSVEDFKREIGIDEEELMTFCRESVVSINKEQVISTLDVNEF